MGPRRVIGMTILALVFLAGCAGNPPRADFPRHPKDDERSFTPAQSEVIKTARSLLGRPYRFGGTTPEGFDCSGFVGYVYRRAARLALPRETHELVHSGKPVSVAEIAPADLVYFKIEHQKPLHVGIYIGDGKFIHAPSARGHVNIQNLGEEYWRDRYLGARRLL
ncbi:MAG TPA: C40 family peptidase [Nitrospiria bacterium]|nr:C40 family peptidase [Nitrospiria bacterium]